MRRISWWFWALTVPFIITPLAVGGALLLAVAVYVEALCDSLEFLWDNMGPDCMDRKADKWRMP